SLGNAVHLIGLKRVLSQIWQIQAPMTIKEISSNYFQFIFSNLEDKVKVLKGTNWLIDNQYLILRDWSESINSQHESFKELEIWVQVWNVPIHWTSTEVGLKIGKAFKRVKNVVIQYGPLAGKCLRMLVTIDIEMPILRYACLQLEGTTKIVEFKYERLVNFCHYCGIIGHLDKNCEKRMQDMDTGNLREGAYGDWLKAHDYPPLGHYQQTNSNSESPSPTPNQKSHTPSPLTVKVNPLNTNPNTDTPSSSNNTCNQNSTNLNPHNKPCNPPISPASLIQPLSPTKSQSSSPITPNTITKIIPHPSSPRTDSSHQITPMETLPLFIPEENTQNLQIVTCPQPVDINLQPSPTPTQANPSKKWKRKQVSLSKG
ncbi:Unknown protein, partial [Striga hermonthica]